MNIQEAMTAVGDRLTEYGQFQNRKHFDMPEYREGVAEKTKAVAAAVRDAMMAVLEKAALLGGDLRSSESGELTDEYWTIRREIEELG